MTGGQQAQAQQEDLGVRDAHGQGGGSPEHVLCGMSLINTQSFMTWGTMPSIPIS